MTFKLSAKFGKSKSGVTSLDDVVKEEDIDSFLNKFIFAVHTPNEVQLGKILTKEVGAHYNLFESDFQSYILKKMLDWFKKKNSEWYSSEREANVGRMRAKDGITPRRCPVHQISRAVERHCRI